MANADKRTINGMGYYVVPQPGGGSTLIVSRDAGDAFGRAVQAGAIDPKSIPGVVNHFNNFDALVRASGASNIYPDSTANHLGGDRAFQTITLPAGVDPDAHMRATIGNVLPSGRISQPTLLQQIAPQAVPNPIVQSPSTAAGDIEARLGAPVHSVAAEAMHPSLAVGQTRYNGAISITQTEPGRFSYQHSDLPGTRIDVSVAPGANPGEVRVNMSSMVGRRTQQAIDGITGRDYDTMLTQLRREAAGSISGLGVNTQSAISTGSFNQTLSGAQLEPAAQRVEARRTAQRQGGDIAQAAINDALRQTGASEDAARIVRDTTGINAPNAPAATVDADGNTRVTGAMPDRTPARYADVALAADSPLARAAAEAPRATPPTPDELAALRQPFRPSAPSAQRDIGAPDQVAPAREPMLQSRSEVPTAPVRETTIVQPQGQQVPTRPTAADGTVILTQEEIAARRAETMARYEASRAQATPQPTPTQTAARTSLPASDTWDVPSNLRHQVAPPEAPRPTQLGGDSRLGQNTMLGGQLPAPHTPPAGTPPIGTPQGGHIPSPGSTASLAADAAHAAPGIGVALSRVGARAARLIPIAGVGITAAAAGANATEATAAYNRGEINATQLAAVVAGGAANTAGAVGSLATGTATEEAVAKMQETAGVPEHLREGTLRQAVTQLGTAVSNAVTPQRVAHTPEQQNFHRFVDGLPERPDPSMSPQLRGIVEANAARLQAERAHSTATQNPQGANVVNARTTLERAEERVDTAYTQLEKSGGLASVQSEINARQQAQRAVAGLNTQVTRPAGAAEEAPQAPSQTPNEKPQPSVAQARA
ncbi:MAG: hypothetical protein C0436_03775 [Alphaproteobacteria bacterium]|nr:hypothetical protein [Alphaproteobacteria bacterium]